MNEFKSSISSKYYHSLAKVRKTVFKTNSRLLKTRVKVQRRSPQKICKKSGERGEITKNQAAVNAVTKYCLIVMN